MIFFYQMTAVHSGKFLSAFLRLSLIIFARYE